MTRSAAIAALCLLAAACACSSKPDPGRPFEMGLDGGKYLWEPAPAVGFVSGYEYNGKYEARGIEIIFPMQRSTARPIPGLDILIKPGLPSGQELPFGEQGDDVIVNYRPSSAQPLPEGIFIGYDSHMPGGRGTITLESCDPRPSGRIKGTIRYARLRSAVYDQQRGDIVPSSKASYLELWNWAFDLYFDQSPYD
jgi:hypothetical protein